MRILVLGAGGVGAAIASIAARRDFFEAMVMADIDPERAASAAAAADDGRFTGVGGDASDQAAVEQLIADCSADVIVNACDPRFNEPIFFAAAKRGITYLDMAMTLSSPHPQRPHEEVGVKLGDVQFQDAHNWESRNQLALVGIGVEPGLADVFARHAADELFSRIDEIGVRDGANLEVEGYAFAPSFSIWTTIEECLNPPVIWERERGWFTTPPFSEPETFDFPDGIGPVECVNVEHEEVLLVPRWVDCDRVTFKYGLGDEFINILQVLHTIGLDRTDPVRVRGAEVSPRDVVAACTPDPARLGPLMSGKTCAGTWARGAGKDGEPLEAYLYQVADNERCMREWGHQCVVWQTAYNPVIALELLHSGAWSGTGVLGPEAMPAKPFLDLLPAYDAPWGIRTRPDAGSPWAESTA